MRERRESAKNANARLLQEEEHLVVRHAVLLRLATPESPKTTRSVELFEKRISLFLFQENNLSADAPLRHANLRLCKLHQRPAADRGFLFIFAVAPYLRNQIRGDIVNLAARIQPGEALEPFPFRRGNKAAGSESGLMASVK